MLTMHYDTSRCKREARKGEVIELEHGIGPSALASGETVYMGQFKGEYREEVALPEGAQIRRMGLLRILSSRFGRTYTIHKSANPEYQPDHPFFGMVTDLNPELLEMKDCKGNTLYTDQLSGNLRFEVVRVPRKSKKDIAETVQ